MKAALALTVSLLALSCGRVSDTGIMGGTGGMRTFVSSAASPQQLAQMQTLCSQLQTKNTNYGFYVNGTSKFNYDTTSSVCGDAVTTASVAPTLTYSGSLLQFVLPPGQTLVTGVETNTSGQMAYFCRSLANLGFPQEISSSVAMWYYVLPNSECQSADPDVQCVYVETGVRQSDGQYLVQTTDRYSFDFSPGQDSGTVIRHERYDMSNCAGGKNTARTAVFKGISN